MATLAFEFDHSANSWAPSEAYQIVDDSTLTDYDTAAETSGETKLNGASRVEVFVTVTPEAAQDVVLSFQSYHTSGWTAFSAADMNKASMDADEYVFETAGSFSFILDSVGKNIRAKYGYRGGTGAGASLTVNLVGRRAV